MHTFLSIAATLNNCGCLRAHVQECRRKWTVTVLSTQLTYSASSNSTNNIIFMMAWTISCQNTLWFAYVWCHLSCVLMCVFPIPSVYHSRLCTPAPNGSLITSPIYTCRLVCVFAESLSFVSRVCLLISATGFGSVFKILHFSRLVVSLSVSMCL